jgi:general secretion pathway protein N
MKRRFGIAISVLMLSIYGGGSVSLSAVSNDAPDDQPDGAWTGPLASPNLTNPATPVVQVVTAPPPPKAVASEQALSTNPLWAMPIAQFPATRDRPLFSPSRRPTPPVVAPVVIPKVVATSKPREPERPQLTLVGTIASDDESFGIFLDQSTNAVLRLKIGENHLGWRLQSVKGREVALEKEQRAIILALPQPGVGQATNEVAPAPASIARLRSMTEQKSDRSGRR